MAADVTRPRHFEGSPYGPYEPQVTVFEDRFFEGATGESLAAMCAARQDVRGYAVLADARSLAEAASGAGITVS